MKKKYLPEKFESDRIHLQKLTADMGDMILNSFATAGDSLFRFVWGKSSITKVDVEAYINSAIERWGEHRFFDYRMFKKSDGAYLGQIGVHTIFWEFDRCEIGYWVFKNFEGHGYVTEAARVLLKQLFDLGFNRIELRCGPQNLRSIAVAKRLEFSFEARVEEDCVEDGKYRDTLLFALTKSKYQMRW